MPSMAGKIIVAGESRTQRVAPGDGGEGALLVASGRLKPDQVERVRALQAKRGLRFGDAAVQLGYVSQIDLQRALAAHFNFPYVTGPSPLSRELVCAYAPFGEPAEAVRNLRTQLGLIHFREDKRSLAIVSAQAADGRSYLTANLAVAFAQLHVPTLVVDADLRDPRQHEIFGLGEGFGLSTVLAGRMELAEAIVAIPGFPALSVLPAGIVPPNPQELLSRGGLEAVLKALATHYEVILLDTPAWRTADAQLVAARVSGCLLVARPHHTRLWRARSLVRGIATAGATLVGIAVNEPGDGRRNRRSWRHHSKHH